MMLSKKKKVLRKSKSRGTRVVPRRGYSGSGGYVGRVARLVVVAV